MTRFELDTAGTKYKQTIEKIFKAKPTPAIRNLEEEIKQLEEAVKRAPEPLRDENTQTRRRGIDSRTRKKR